MTTKGIKSMDAQNILQELCHVFNLREEGISLDNPLVLNFDDSFEITFTPDGDTIYLSTALRSIDSASRENLIELLKANSETNNVAESLALDSEGSRVILIRCCEHINSLEELEAVTESFICSRARYVSEMPSCEESGQNAKEADGSFTSFGFDTMLAV